MIAKTESRRVTKMLITDKFTLIHMHKTGGQTLSNIIVNNISNPNIVGYHYPISEIPDADISKPVIGIVRNPWDWYVSWYFFNKNAEDRNTLFVILSDGGQADFKTTITNLINLGSDNKSSELYRKALISVLPDSLEGNQGVGLTKQCIEGFSTNSQGYYSWLFTRMHGNLDAENLHIGLFEDLQNSFISIMKKLDVSESEKIEQSFASTGKLNSSSRAHYSRYFDDELLQLIQHKESEIIKRYNYQYQLDNNDTFSFIEQDEFKKLSGKAKNFLHITNLDVSSLVAEVKKIQPDVWNASSRKERFEVHTATHSLNFIFDVDFCHYNPTYLTSYYHFIHLLEPIEKVIYNHFKHDGFIGRMMLTKLKANSEINVHVDNGYSLLHCHRMHIPLVTNENVIFTIGGEAKNIRAGELWEINNATLHTVNNTSDTDRIHLIIDWIPNNTVLEEEKAKRANLPTNNPIVQPCPCGSGKLYGNCHRAW